MLGTLVGGAITYFSSERAQDRQLHAQQHRDAIAARTAARLQTQRYQRIDRAVIAMIRTDRFIVVAGEFPSPLSVSDQKLVVANLGPHQADALAVADLQIDLVRATLHGKHTDERIASSDVAELKLGHEVLQTATAAEGDGGELAARRGPSACDTAGVSQDAAPTSSTSRTGEEHRIRLAGLGTAGYRWMAAVEGDEGVVEVIAAGVARPANRRIGTSADELFDIRAIGPGVARVRFLQRRPFEPDDVPPADEQVVEVRVT